MSELQDAEKLWAVHIVGPDEVFAAPSHEMAESAVTRMNQWLAGKGGVLVECGVQFKVIEWPYTRESHNNSKGSFAADFGL